MRNASGHQDENERQWKNKVNKNTYDISSIKRVTRKFLEVSRCSRAKQRQRKKKSFFTLNSELAKRRHNANIYETLKPPPHRDFSCGGWKLSSGELVVACPPPPQSSFYMREVSFSRKTCCCDNSAAVLRTWPKSVLHVPSLFAD